MQITYRYRVKDEHVARLAAQAAAVVWNYCNEVQTKIVNEGRKWLGCHDLDRLTKGVTKAGLDLHSQPVQKICEQYDTSRQQHRKPWLNWRKTRGVRRSPGWVPFNQQALKYGTFVFRGERYDVWLHRRLPQNAKIGCGSFSEDSRGRWYINVPVEVQEATQAINARVGIDLAEAPAFRRG